MDRIVGDPKKNDKQGANLNSKKKEQEKNTQDKESSMCGYFIY